MAHVSIELAAPPEAAFALLTDPWSYPRWLVGASAIRAVDGDWPAPGSRFHHRVGFGPLAVPDSSEVLAIEAPGLLRLAVRARPLITAVVTFRVIGGDGCCVLAWEEEPARRLVGNLVRPVVDPLTHLRNHRSLVRFRAVLAERQAP